MNLRFVMLNKYSQKQNMTDHWFYVNEILKMQMNKIDQKWIMCFPGLGGGGDVVGKGAWEIFEQNVIALNLLRSFHGCIQLQNLIKLYVLMDYIHCKYTITQYNLFFVKRWYYKQLYASEVDNLDKMNKWLKNTTYQNWHKEKSLNGPISMKIGLLIIITLFTERTLDRGSFTKE